MTTTFANPAAHQPLAIDLVDPRTAMQWLGASEGELIALVNQDRIDAYRIGDHIRFRRDDVASLATARAA